MKDYNNALSGAPLSRQGSHSYFACKNMESYANMLKVNNNRREGYAEVKFRESDFVKCKLSKELLGDVTIDMMKGLSNIVSICHEDILSFKTRRSKESNCFIFLNCTAYGEVVLKLSSPAERDDWLFEFQKAAALYLNSLTSYDSFNKIGLTSALERKTSNNNPKLTDDDETLNQDDEAGDDATNASRRRRASLDPNQKVMPQYIVDPQASGRSLSVAVGQPANRSTSNLFRNRTSPSSAHVASSPVIPIISQLHRGFGDSVSVSHANSMGRGITGGALSALFSDTSASNKELEDEEDNENTKVARSYVAEETQTSYMNTMMERLSLDNSGNMSDEDDCEGIWRDAEGYDDDGLEPYRKSESSLQGEMLFDLDERPTENRDSISSGGGSGKIRPVNRSPSVGSGSGSGKSSNADEMEGGTIFSKSFGNNRTGSLSSSLHHSNGSVSRSTSSPLSVMNNNNSSSPVVLSSSVSSSFVTVPVTDRSSGLSSIFGKSGIALASGNGANPSTNKSDTESNSLGDNNMALSDCIDCRQEDNKKIDSNSKSCTNSVACDSNGNCMEDILPWEVGHYNISAKSEDYMVHISDYYAEHASQIENDSCDTDRKLCFFAVYDGHQGKQAAKFMTQRLHHDIFQHPLFEGDAEKAISETCLNLDNEFLDVCNANNWDCGTTVMGVFIRDKELFSFSIGDSQGVLCRSGRAINLNDPHKPKRRDEEERILAANGWLILDSELSFLKCRLVDLQDYWVHQLADKVQLTTSTHRVVGEISVSRSIGDRLYKKLDTTNALPDHHFLFWPDGHSRKMNGDLLIADPEVNVFPLTSEDEFFILGSDGLWDVISPDDAIRIVQSLLKDGSSVNDAASRLCTVAKKLGSQDDISVIVVKLGFL